MREESKEQKDLSVSMLWITLGLGLSYWIFDSVLMVINSKDSSFLHSLISIDNKDFWQRLMALCFLVIFASHIQETTRGKGGTSADP